MAITMLMILLAALRCEARLHLHMFPTLGKEMEAVNVIPGCRANSISIENFAAPSTPGHAPAFQVQILNTCECGVSRLVLACPNFASAELIDPHVMKIQGDGTCLVKDGKVVDHGEIVSFRVRVSRVQVRVLRVLDRHSS